MGVDLAIQQVLFALLTDEHGSTTTAQMWPEHLFRDLSSGSERILNIHDIASNVGLSRELPRYGPRISDSRDPFVQYPLLVRFRGLDRPESLEAVSPDALDAAFGPGVKLKRIMIQITDEPVTDRIKTRLPWLEEVGRVRGTIIPKGEGSLAHARPVKLVGPSDFTTELYK